MSTIQDASAAANPPPEEHIPAVLPRTLPPLPTPPSPPPLPLTPARVTPRTSQPPRKFFDKTQEEYKFSDAEWNRLYSIILESPPGMTVSVLELVVQAIESLSINHSPTTMLRVQDLFLKTYIAVGLRYKANQISMGHAQPIDEGTFQSKRKELIDQWTKVLKQPDLDATASESIRIIIRLLFVDPKALIECVDHRQTQSETSKADFFKERLSFLHRTFAPLEHVDFLREISHQISEITKVLSTNKPLTLKRLKSGLISLKYAILGRIALCIKKIDAQSATTKDSAEQATHGKGQDESTQIPIFEEIAYCILLFRVLEDLSRFLDSTLPNSSPPPDLARFDQKAQRAIIRLNTKTDRIENPVSVADSTLAIHNQLLIDLYHSTRATISYEYLTMLTLACQYGGEKALATMTLLVFTTVHDNLLELEQKIGSLKKKNKRFSKIVLDQVIAEFEKWTQIRNQLAIMLNVPHHVYPSFALLPSLVYQEPAELPPGPAAPTPLPPSPGGSSAPAETSTQSPPMETSPPAGASTAPSQITASSSSESPPSAPSSPSTNIESSPHVASSSKSSPPDPSPFAQFPETPSPSSAASPSPSTPALAHPPSPRILRTPLPTTASPTSSAALAASPQLLANSPPYHPPPPRSATPIPARRPPTPPPSLAKGKGPLNANPRPDLSGISYEDLTSGRYSADTIVQALPTNLQDILMPALDPKNLPKLREINKMIAEIKRAGYSITVIEPSAGSHKKVIVNGLNAGIMAWHGDDNIQPSHVRTLVRNIAARLLTALNDAGSATNPQ